MEVKEKNTFGCECWDFECENCQKILTISLQLRLEYLLEKHGVQELDRSMTLDVAENKRLTDLAVYMVNNNE